MPLLAVNHHYYRRSAPSGGIYPISPERLSAEVASLRQRHRLPKLEEFRSILEEPEIWSSEELAILTFDDGLKEQMAALKDLESAGTAAMFFVPTTPLSHAKVLDVHKIHLIRSVCDDAFLLHSLKEAFPSQFKKVVDDDATLQYRYDTPIARRIKYLLNFVLDADSRDDWVSRTFSQYVGSESAVSKELYMDAEDIRLLGKLGLLGTHGHNHLPLAQIDVAIAEADILESMDILTDISGEEIRGISYPYGGPTAVSQSVTRLCSKLGLRYGLSMQRGRNHTDSGLDLMLLKRIDCNDAEDFA